MTCDYIGAKQVTAWKAEKDGKPGYGVKYADGYTSWSPEDVFDDAYICIGHVQHLPQFAQRMVGELALLTDKINKLEEFLLTDNALNLDAKIIDLMHAQKKAMWDYKIALNQRLGFAVEGGGS